MIARLTPTARAMSSICASRTPLSSNSCRVAARIARSRSRRRAAAGCRVSRAELMLPEDSATRVYTGVRESSVRSAQCLHRLQQVGLCRWLVVAVPQHPGEPEGHPAGVAGGALDAVEGDLDHLLGADVHDVAGAGGLQAEEALRLPLEGLVGE